MPVSVTKLQPGQVDTFWPHIAEGMHRSCVKSGGQISAGYLWQECRNGGAFLYIVHDGAEILGASVMAFREWPSGLRYIGLGLCGKNAAEWFDTLWEHARIDGKAGGAIALIDSPRPGMKKYLDRPGVKVIQVMYEEKL